MISVLVGKVDAESALRAEGVHRVAPSFRLVAVATPPSKSGKNAWLVDEIAAMFHFHVLKIAQDQSWRGTCLLFLFFY